MNKYLVEFLGTMFFLYVILATGDAVAIGLGLTVAIMVIGKHSGGHFNPAVTASYWMAGKMEQEEAKTIMIHQVIGAAAGLVLAYILQLGASDFADTDIPEGNLSVPAGYLGVVLLTGISTAILSMIYMAIDNNKNEWIHLLRGIILTLVVGSLMAGGSGTNPAILAIDFLTSLTNALVIP